jgi:phosphoglycolate phosphatase
VPPRAIAFDLDGTLIDSRRDIAAACNHALVAAGRPPLPLDVIITFVGDGVRALVARAFGLSDDDPALDPHVAATIAYYEAHPVDGTVFLPGALEALDAADHLPVALVTNKARPVTLAVLDGLGVRGRFAFVYAGGDGPLKPSAEPVVACARALTIDVRSLWVVGDGDQDVRAARAAGAVAVGVLGGFTQEEKLRAADPDVVLAAIGDLPRLLRGDDDECPSVHDRVTR